MLTKHYFLHKKPWGLFAIIINGRKIYLELSSLIYLKKKLTPIESGKKRVLQRNDCSSKRNCKRSHLYHFNIKNMNFLFTIFIKLNLLRLIFISKDLISMKKTKASAFWKSLRTLIFLKDY